MYSPTPNFCGQVSRALTRICVSPRPGFLLHRPLGKRPVAAKGCCSQACASGAVSGDCCAGNEGQRLGSPCLDASTTHREIAGQARKICIKRLPERVTSELIVSVKINVHDP